MEPDERLRFDDPAGRPLSRREVVERWISDPAFADAFSSRIAASPSAALFWETPPWTTAGLDRPFECVLLAAPSLARIAANPAPFREPLHSTADPVAVFPSLGGDADLIAPRDLGDGAGYAHLAAFLRSATTDQRRLLWRRVGETVLGWLGCREPFWVSTSGLGVAWLHVRIDSRPKYYSYGPYRSPEPPPPS